MSFSAAHTISDHTADNVPHEGTNRLPDVTADQRAICGAVKRFTGCCDGLTDEVSFTAADAMSDYRTNRPPY